MPRRLLLAVFGALWAVTISAAPARADGGWVITSFASTIAISSDGSLVVQEDIKVDFGSQQHHGIFRTIPVRYRYDSTRDRYYVLTVNSVTDGSKVLPYTTSSNGDFAWRRANSSCRRSE